MSLNICLNELNASVLEQIGKTLPQEFSAKKCVLTSLRTFAPITYMGKKGSKWEQNMFKTLENWVENLNFLILRYKQPIFKRDDIEWKDIKTLSKINSLTWIVIYKWASFLSFLLTCSIRFSSANLSASSLGISASVT